MRSRPKSAPPCLFGGATSDGFTPPGGGGAGGMGARKPAPARDDLGDSPVPTGPTAPIWPAARDQAPGRKVSREGLRRKQPPSEREPSCPGPGPYDNVIATRRASLPAC